MPQTDPVNTARKGLASEAGAINARELDLSLGQGGEAYARVASLAGGRVNVPGYLAGRPDHMTRRKRVVSTRHLAIYVSIMACGMTTADQMLGRSRAILGAIAGLQAAGVSVDLYLMCDTQGCGWYKGPKTGLIVDETHPDDQVISVVPIDSRPVDLSQVAGSLGQRRFLDLGVFEWARDAYGFDGRWSQAYRPAGLDPVRGISRYTEILRERLGLGPEAVIFPRVSYLDPLLADPDRWVAERVNQAMKGDGQ
jgi:hypothetical protein